MVESWPRCCRSSAGTPRRGSTTGQGGDVLEGEDVGRRWAWCSAWARWCGCPLGAPVVGGVPGDGPAADGVLAEPDPDDLPVADRVGRVGDRPPGGREGEREDVALRGVDCYRPAGLAQRDDGGGDSRCRTRRRPVVAAWACGAFSSASRAIIPQRAGRSCRTAWPAGTAWARRRHGQKSSVPSYSPYVVTLVTERCGIATQSVQRIKPAYKTPVRSGLITDPLPCHLIVIKWRLRPARRSRRPRGLGAPGTGSDLAAGVPADAAAGSSAPGRA